MPDEKDNTSETVDAHVLELLRHVLKRTWDVRNENVVALALLYLLTRVSNTWQSIKTLRKYSLDDEVFMVDAGMMLRAMFDAYLQAEYIVSDPTQAERRASDYLDFENVEKFKCYERLRKYDNALTRHLMNSPERREGEKRLLEAYDRVKNRYAVERRQEGSRGGHQPKTGNKWYRGDLAGIARSLGKEDEYDCILAVFHGCVHSSALAVRLGPPVHAEYVSHWALTIAARVAKLSVVYNEITLADLHIQIMDQLNRPYFAVPE